MAKKSDEQSTKQEAPQAPEEEQKVEAQEYKLYKVKYEGEGDVVNYDIAPYNIVEDEVAGGTGQRAILDPGKTYEVPEDLARRLFLSDGFKPVGKESRSLQKSVFGEGGDISDQEEAPPVDERAAGRVEEAQGENEQEGDK